jgi:CheY-like chemotaxis protein
MSAHQSGHILVVDDEQNIRLMLRTILQIEGFDVAEAANGVEALSHLCSASFDLMILDLNMPVMDGMSVLEQLRLSPPRKAPRTIVLSAYGSISAAVRATRLGALDFVEKPITPEELRSAVASAMLQPDPSTVTVAPENPQPGYEDILNRVRRSLRAGETASAESLLLKVADLAGGREAAYFNLIGALYEIQQNWRLAAKFYGKACKADRHYAPATNNQQRYYEMTTFGRSALPILLGDEAEESALNRLLKQHQAVGSSSAISIDKH